MTLKFNSRGMLTYYFPSFFTLDDDDETVAERRRVLFVLSLVSLLPREWSKMIARRGNLWAFKLLRLPVTGPCTISYYACVRIAFSKGTLLQYEDSGFIHSYFPPRVTVRARSFCCISVAARPWLDLVYSITCRN